MNYLKAKEGRLVVMLLRLLTNLILWCGWSEWSDSSIQWLVLLECPFQVNIYQNSWIFHPGKVLHSCWFWEEFPNFTLHKFCRQFQLVPSQSEQTDNLENSLLGRDFTAQVTFPMTGTFPSNLSCSWAVNFSVIISI